MALSYLSGVINNNKNEMEDLGIVYPNVKKQIRGKIKTVNIAKKNKTILNKQLAFVRSKLLSTNLKPLARKKWENRLRLVQSKLSKLNGDIPAELGRSKKRSSKPKRTKGQLIKKLKTTIKKAKERRKADKHSPKEKLQHKLAKVALAVPRGAFLGLILLGKALEKTPIKINLAKNLKDKWASKGKAIEKMWYKLGGEVDILKAQISKATNSKLSGNMGAVVAATAAGSVAAATPILVKIMKILGKGVDFAKKNPKLLAVGEKLMKSKLNDFAKKKGKTEELAEVSEVVSDLTESLPAATKQAVDDAKEEVTKETIDKVDDKATEEVKETKENIQAEENNEGVNGSSNTKIALIGAAVLVGGYLLMKKK